MVDSEQGKKPAWKRQQGGRRDRAAATQERARKKRLERWSVFAHGIHSVI